MDEVLCGESVCSNIKFSERVVEEVESADGISKLPLKMPTNLKGKIFLPLFDPATMSLTDLQNVTKTLFRDAWGELIVITCP